MESWIAVIGLLTALLGLLARFDPRFTADGRRQARIARDLELLDTMHEGAVEMRLRASVNAATNEMLDERERDKTQDRLTWLVLLSSGSGLVIVAMLDNLPTESLSDQLLYLVLVGAMLAFSLLIPVGSGLALWHTRRKSVRRDADRASTTAVNEHEHVVAD